eukprot:CAMPEP_0196660642 /NCGR_PEP_ID=MMETSP1086-20130531/40768_1 /TAXON_ID=77921 /ORGANISM="Cyanoptyche  gloeocystis , Strain SAG4.97" /LENGTH=153 /DNA_ID=CAMNT_0041995161 /DNA_START=74 /DNA_END=532 /DNA_ORIENTATION=-
MEYSGSRYEGDYCNGRIEGSGKYTFPDGNYYVGELKDGMFHGNGILYFPGFGKYTASWANGLAVEGVYTFADGLEYQDQKWQYCSPTDRRFYSEICNGLKPAGESQACDSEKAPDIPQGCYDVGDGYFNPDKGKIYSYQHKYIRMPSSDEVQW